MTNEEHQEKGLGNYQECIILILAFDAYMASLRELLGQELLLN